MRHKLLASLLAVIALPIALPISPAHAADGGGTLGERAPLVLVVDHLAGVVRTSAVNPDRDDVEISTNEGGTKTRAYAITPLARLGVHYFVTPNISLGAGVHWWTGAVGTFFSEKQTVLGISPRVGFAVPVGSDSAIWIRGGVTYLHISSDDGDVSENDLAIGGEVQYVSTPVSHFGWMLGPTIEWGVSGEVEPERGDSRKIRRRMIGLTFGVLFDF
jgi:hypothetical protein